MDVVNVVGLACIICIGLLVNTMALVYLCQKRSVNTVKDRVVIMLCVINSLQSVGFGMELNAAMNGVVVGIQCKIATFLVCSLTFTSIGFFVILAIERYVAIVHPFQYNPWFSRKNSFIWLCISPVYGFSIAAIPLLGWSGYARPRNNSIYCTFDFKLESTKSYFIFASIVVFVGPITLTTICFGFIIAELRRTALETRRLYGTSSSISIESSKAVMEQSLSLILTALVYFGSWTPYSALCMAYFTDQNISFAFENSAKFLSKSCTISSTVVYCLIERRFRYFVRKEVSTKMRKISQSFERKRARATTLETVIN